MADYIAFMVISSQSPTRIIFRPANDRDAPTPAVTRAPGGSAAEKRRLQRLAAAAVQG